MCHKIEFEASNIGHGRNHFPSLLPWSGKCWCLRRIRKMLFKNAFKYFFCQFNKVHFHPFVSWLHRHHCIWPVNWKMTLSKSVMLSMLHTILWIEVGIGAYQIIVIGICFFHSFLFHSRITAAWVERRILGSPWCHHTSRAPDYSHAEIWLEHRSSA